MSNGQLFEFKGFSLDFYFFPQIVAFFLLMLFLGANSIYLSTIFSPNSFFANRIKNSPMATGRRNPEFEYELVDTMCYHYTGD